MDRREEIIRAALELAAENGLKSVSMAQIAERVGMKAPSLYNHFRSKEEIIKTMYRLLRESARTSRAPAFIGPEAFSSKTLEQILTESLSAYLGMVIERDMLRFFRVLYAERASDPLAAEILLEETAHMIGATRNLFYALAVHGRMKSEGIDTAAMSFALTVHALVDYRMDQITAGHAERFGEGESPFPGELRTFISWFSAQMGGKPNETEAY